ncbi:MAG: glucokinase [Alphaproteobacteria bacterium]
MAEPAEAPRLLGDIGGTNARFALQRPGGGADAIRVLPTADFRNLADAVNAYLDGFAARPVVRRAAVCVAGPVLGDHFVLTNSDWEFSIEATRRALDLERLHVVNDFAAVALAVPHLDRASLVQVGGAPQAERAPIVVMGAGTGLGVCGLTPMAGGWLPLPGEGGHATLPAASAREEAVFARIRAQYGHCSAERVLSGGGLVNLYRALHEVDGSAADPVQPEDVTRRAESGEARADEAVEMFCEATGTVAGNLALTFAALGGVYFAGGIIRLLGPRFVASGFRARFEAKGRFRPLLQTVPAWQIAQPFSAMVGLASLLDAEG